MPDLTVPDLRLLSTDTRPLAAAGTVLTETDTGDQLVSDGTYWWFLRVGAFSSKRWGVLPWSASSNGDGMLNTMTAGTGHANTFGNDNTNGRYWQATTGAVSGNKGGARPNTSSLVQRQFDCRARIVLQLPAATDYTNSRLWLGFKTSTAEPTGDDVLNATSGIMVGYNSANPATNFKVLRNDGTTTADYTGDVAGTAQATDTILHTVSIVADNANSKFAIKWDSNAYVDFTTDIPAAATAMTFWLSSETAEAAAKTCRIYRAWIQQEK